MDRNLKENLNYQKETILSYRFQEFLTIEDLVNELEGRIKNYFEISILNIQNILMHNQRKEEIFIGVMNEIISTLRREIFENCQKISSDMDQFGVGYTIETLPDDLIGTIFINKYLIELCNQAIVNECIKENDEPINKKIYIYSSSLQLLDNPIVDNSAIKLISDDLSKIGKKFYRTFNKVIDEMESGRYDGNREKRKQLKDSDGCFEYRGFPCVRMYGNSIKSSNNSIKDKIKKLEDELDAKICFIYMLETKKCIQTNGSSSKRKKRYKNEKERYEELFSGDLSASDVKKLACKSHEMLKQYLSEKIKETSEDDLENNFERSDIIPELLDTINSYLHTNYELSSENIEINFDSKDGSEEYEKFQICNRILMYLRDKTVDELRKLARIFDDVGKYMYDDKYEDVERNRIICILMSTFSEMSLEQLKKKEIDILMIIDYEEESFSDGKIREEVNSYERRK